MPIFGWSYGNLKFTNLAYCLFVGFKDTNLESGTPTLVDTVTLRRTAILILDRIMVFITLHSNYDVPVSGV